MIAMRSNPWHVDRVDADVVQHLVSVHTPNAEALKLGVDIVGDPHREDDDGHNWARLHAARNVADVTPGSAVVMGSPIGNYLAKVLAWDFEVSDEDPIVVLELLPVTPQAVERALARRGVSAA